MRRPTRSRAMLARRMADHMIDGFDVFAYATLAAALGADGADRDALLAAHGLDEARWASLDTRFQQWLSDELETGEDDDAIPASAVAYSESYGREQRRSEVDVISIERFAEATRAIAKSNDIAATLRRLELTLPQYLKANEHWTSRLIHDAELLERFQRVMTK